MTSNDEVTHIAQHLAAIDLATDVEWIAAEWPEFQQGAYLAEAHKLIAVADALAAYRAAKAPNALDGMVKA